MPILVFGGSFNPIHCGHLICARAVAEKRGFEQVLLIPSAQPPHKPEASDIAPAEDRLAMCRLAAADENAKPTVVDAHGKRAAGSAAFAVDDIEMRRSGPSYTLDTACELKRRGIVPVHWLIGADMLLYLPNWHRPDALLAEVDFVVMKRPGYAIDWAALPAWIRHLEANVVDAPLIDISATDIRRRVQIGERIDHLTPPPVAKYITDHGLYRI